MGDKSVALGLNRMWGYFLLLDFDRGGLASNSLSQNFHNQYTCFKQNRKTRDSSTIYNFIQI